ncbi:MAG: hypothetical protein K9N51_03970 [Candidatus Pacebacteria bacterium]|nr:hypothetical protein [Candidatus Paceibacterota bacterium]
MNLYTFIFADELQIDYGNVSFGAEPPQAAGQSKGLDFVIGDVIPDADGYTVYGLRRTEAHIPQVWKARTKDGMTFSDAELLFELPPPDNRWLAGDVAVAGDRIFCMNCDCGNPVGAGHSFHVFAGTDDGGWSQLNSEPVYKGQDAFSLIWDGQQFVCYQTSYQPYRKRFADNMGDNIRRVLHIRTSPDCLEWTPGGSFGVDGPYLPDEQLITPDADDPPETEFYKFRPFRQDGFWAGALVKYISQPPILPKSGRFPHGPFLGCEWWVSRNGRDWQRPVRHTSNLDTLPLQSSYFMHKPFRVGHEMRWCLRDAVYSYDYRRRFYAYCPANAVMTTPPLRFEIEKPRLHVSFESVRLNKQGALRQGYLMAELVGQDGKTIEGFEKEKCLHKVSDATTLDLCWEGRTPASRADKEPAQLRLHFRDVRIYSLEH